MSDAPVKCTRIDGCELFPAFSKPGFLRVWQINYCEADFERCERYRLSREGQPVPATMLPNGKLLSFTPKG